MRIYVPDGLVQVREALAESKKLLDEDRSFSPFLALALGKLGEALEHLTNIVEQESRK